MNQVDEAGEGRGRFHDPFRPHALHEEVDTEEHFPCLLCRVQEETFQDLVPHFCRLTLKPSHLEPIPEIGEFGAWELTDRGFEVEPFPYIESWFLILELKELWELEVVDPHFVHVVEKGRGKVVEELGEDDHPLTNQLQLLGHFREDRGEFLGKVVHC